LGALHLVFMQVPAVFGVLNLRDRCLANLNVGSTRAVALTKHAAKSQSMASFKRPLTIHILCLFNDDWKQCLDANYLRWYYFLASSVLLSKSEAANAKSEDWIEGSRQELSCRSLYGHWCTSDFPQSVAQQKSSGKCEVVVVC
jgi:hypothetical protein